MCNVSNKTHLRMPGNQLKNKKQNVNFTESELAASYQLAIGTPDRTHFLVSLTFGRLGKFAGMSSCDDAAVTPRSHPSFPWGS